MKHLPWWLPFLKYDKSAKRAKELTVEMVDESFDDVKSRMVSNARNRSKQILTSLSLEE